MLYDPKWKKPEVTSVAQILIDARKLIEDPSDWVCHAPNHAGENCAATAIWNADRHARGVTSAATDRASEEAERAFTLLGQVIGGDVPTYNDGHNHAQVLAAFDRAIERAA